ncbi:hypothetical protein [Hyphococcus sp.]|uniref:hypothetical protein n=1 Tax=Hyphococcus sp. TaxID=2038636 RepID=UPI0035C750EC
MKKMMLLLATVLAASSSSVYAFDSYDAPRVKAVNSHPISAPQPALMLTPSALAPEVIHPVPPAPAFSTPLMLQEIKPNEERRPSELADIGARDGLGARGQKQLQAYYAAGDPAQIGNAFFGKWESFDQISTTRHFRAHRHSP